MRDSGSTDAERRMQLKFSIRALGGALALLAAILLFQRWLNTIPDRAELGRRDARIAFRPVPLDPAGFAPLRLAGAWKLTSDDPRFGGVSGLAVDGGRLLALTDSGVLIRFKPLERRAEIRELPDGPGDGGFKRNRDSEALVRDPAGRGWWVAFENHHELWLYDPGFRRAIQRLALGDRGWRANRGVEGIATEGANLLLFPEIPGTVLRVAGTRVRTMPVANARGRISDAVAIGPGRFLAIERRPTPLGFRNALVTVEGRRSGYRFGRPLGLGLGASDNVEAIAVEPLPGGRRRLWLMTDDNGQPPLRTLLIALELPAGRPAPGR
jgi:hypothetical protein